jgi:tetratricopeptide (TPR) repeat protein
MEELKDRLVIAWLREEEWGVTSFLDFLLRVFRALAKVKDDPKIEKQISTLFSMPSRNAEFEAAEMLRKFIGNKTLLIIIENLDDLFGGIADEGQKRLRAYLQQESFITLLATAQSLFNGVSLETSPFYGFFRIQTLKELTQDEAADLLRNISRLQKDTELAEFIQTPLGHARINAIHHLAGGNHRIYVILSQFLSRNSLNELVDPFMKALDDLTPYYQSRMAWLSPQQRKVVEFLCERRGATSVKEIAKYGFMTQQTASSQLVTLKEKGYVRAIRIGRRSYYELREPLLRICVEVKNQREQPVRLLVEFLRLWFSPKELQKRLSSLTEEGTESHERVYILSALRSSEDRYQDQATTAFEEEMNSCLQAKDYVRASKLANDLVARRGKPIDFLNMGYCKAGLGKQEDALLSFRMSVEKDPTYSWGWILKGLTEDVLDKKDDAMVSFTTATTVDPENYAMWDYLGEAQLSRKNYDSALKSFRLAISLKSDDPRALTGEGKALSGLDRDAEAATAFEKALALDPKNIDTQIEYGLTQFYINKFDRAIAVFDKILVEAPNLPAVLALKAFVLTHDAKHEEALVDLEKALALFPNDGLLISYRGINFVALGSIEKGFDELEHGFSLDPDKEFVSGLCYRLLNYLIPQFSKNDKSWNLALSRLFELYSRNNLLTELGQAIVRSLTSLEREPSLISSMLGRLRDEASAHQELEIPLRLFEAGCMYLEKRDRSALLSLPSEERSLLLPLLGLETDQDKRSDK